MRNKTAMLLISQYFTLVSLASTPLLHTFICQDLDRIAFNIAGSENGAVALELLELVAMNQTQKITPEMAAAFNFNADRLKEPMFGMAEVRSCALDKIGETMLDEAVAFLQGLKQEDFASDITGSIWPSAQSALSNARLIRINDRRLR